MNNAEVETVLTGLKPASARDDVPVLPPRPRGLSEDDMLRDHYSSLKPSNNSTSQQRKSRIFSPKDNMARALAGSERYHGDYASGPNVRPALQATRVQIKFPDESSHMLFPKTNPSSGKVSSHKVSVTPPNTPRPVQSSLMVATGAQSINSQGFNLRHPSSDGVDSLGSVIVNNALSPRGLPTISRMSHSNGARASESRPNRSPLHSPHTIVRNPSPDLIIHPKGGNN